MEVTIARASIADLPILADINRLAYLPEAISQFAWTNWPDKTDMYDFYTSRLRERFSSPETEVLKATETETGEIVGFVCWTREHGDKDKLRSGEPVPMPTAASLQQMPVGMNMEFVVTSGAEIESLMNHMKGTEHYCKSLTMLTATHS